MLPVLVAKTLVYGDLYHFGVRAYDPTLRRWLSPDLLLLFAPDKDVECGDNLNLYFR
jgi:RHS repeat-associated protein